MRTKLRLLLVPLLVASQVALGQVHPTATALAATDSVVAESTVQNLAITLNPTQPKPLEVKGYVAPNFDAEVLAPLRAKQAEIAAAAEAQAKAAKRAQLAKLASATVKTLIGPATGDAWYQLRMCEAGNNYARNSGNGFYGAYQFDIGTWNHYGGYARADLAPPAVQDAKAQDTQARRGWSPWPACSRKLGLR